jgi:predicted oxidoreductase
MDRIRRRQIGARPFLRPEKFWMLQPIHSDYVQFGAGERGKCHAFGIGNIHGTATGDLFFLIHGSGASEVQKFFVNFFSFISL